MQNNPEYKRLSSKIEENPKFFHLYFYNKTIIEGTTPYVHGSI